MSKVIGFSQLGKADAAQVGAKAANLGELTSMGMPVPGGFVVTAEACEEFFNGTELAHSLQKFIGALDYDDPKRLHHVASRIRQLINATPLPYSMGEAIRDQVNDHRVYAVRSSALGEDSEGASFAGQHATYTNVKGKNVERHVKRCFASLFEPRALAYRLKQGLSVLDARMAVVVQEMFNAQVSGVMFTRDYNTGESKLIIEAVRGLGEAIVSGAVTPDHYEVVNSELTEYTVYHQEKYLDPHTGKWGNLGAWSQGEAKLSKGLIYQLAAMGQEIALHYGDPQDIEWGFDGYGFAILQARPITTGGKEKGEELENPVIVSGQAASFGVATGKVVVINELSELSQVEQGDVMVTTMTTPDYVPVFHLLAGLVTDLGGATCHAAIISREFDLPCVVGTVSGTQVLASGQQVIVDGGNGLVHQA